MERPKGFKHKYRIGQSGNVQEIPSDEEGICDCQRYCGGGKVVRGATFRRHNSRTDNNDATPISLSDQNKRRKRVEIADVGEGETNFLVDKLANMPEPSVTELREWFDRENIWIHRSLEIKAMTDSSGLGIFAVDVGVPQQVVCKIPRSAILSSRTTPFAESLPRSTRSQIPAIALLSLSLLYEFRWGQKSRYWGYLQSLPRRHVDIAPLWSVFPITGEDGQSAVEKVKGTEVEAELRRIKKDGHGLEDLRLYHKATKDAFPLTDFSPLPPSFLDVLYTYSLVSSRAFQVDVYHGAALVPLADIFNHQELNNVCFESDDFVCEICGSLPTCEHDEIEGTEPRQATEPGQHHETPEMIDIAERLSHLPLEVIRSLFDPMQNTLDLTVKTLYEPGQEVFNTYGEGMSWAKQACEWGFIDESIEGEGVLGRGLKWEVGDIMDRDKENHEKIKKAWKSQCKTWSELDTAPSNGSLKTATEPGGDSLFFPPGEGALLKDALLINDDAQVAYPLLWGIACGLELAFTQHEMLAIPQALNVAAQKLQRQQEDSGEPNDLRAKQAPGGATKKKLRKISEGMLRLFEDRLARTWLENTSTSVLCDQLDNVSLRLSEVGHGLERMALKILVSEHRVLEVAIAVWQDLREAF
ncbi:hypothetical protein QFC22_003040 [Naganishia vaughanmartiniae]|uniref:Uncharacterized protein n=1 Tax=Naganishia vaughanmartiniae TaxID=1424756 RepID=A0ACC2X929_9TREE|nr:hypothetical protein QFC22_003040 [Naganishia vaughanmartiniae]